MDYEKKNSNLLDFWVKGLSFDWGKFYGGVKPRCISLPTYPFAKEHYWIPTKKMKFNTSEAAAALEVVNTLKIPTKETPLEITVAEVPDTSVSNKPTGVPLLSLPQEKMVLHKPIDTIDPITIELTGNDPLCQSAVWEEPSSVLQSQEIVSEESLMEELAESLSEVLSMEKSEIDFEDNFVEMGLDSITGVEWIQTINKRYGLTIAATKVYDYPNLCEFTAFSHKELQKTLSSPLRAVNSDLPRSVFPLIELPVADMAAVHGENGYERNETIPQESKIRSAQLSESLLDALAVSIAEVLSMEPNEIDIDEKFIDMGLDSITGVEWIQGINKRYGTSIAATKVYDYPCIRDFARFIEKELSLHEGGNDCVAVPAPVFSLQDVLKQVHLGLLDIEQADQMLQQRK